MEGDDMTFNRIDEHTVRCILNEKEISQMGYDLTELFQKHDQAESFLKEIITRAKEAGFSMTQDYQTIQSMFLPDHQIILNISDISMEKPINEMIQNYLNAYDIVRRLGKKRLKGIMKLEGIEKIQAFHEFMSEIHINDEDQKETKEDKLPKEEAKTINEVIPEELISKQYLLRFGKLDEVDQFSKQVSIVIPSKLYKDRNKYCLLMNIKSMEYDVIRGILLLAQEYSEEIKEDNNYSAYLEEHADVIIKENAISVLRNI